MKSIISLLCLFVATQAMSAETQNPVVKMQTNWVQDTDGFFNLFHFDFQSVIWANSQKTNHYQFWLLQNKFGTKIGPLQNNMHSNRADAK